MYLLNRQQMITRVNNTRLNYLNIRNFELKNLQHTSYYFRVGQTYKIFNSDNNIEEKKLNNRNEIITIKPNQYILIQSAEVFILSDKVKALIGSCGVNIENGLLLNYSPFIDPLYEGWIEVGVKNLLDFDIHLKIGQKLGKVSFIDISDTYPIEIAEGTFQKSKFENRALFSSESDDGIRYPEEEDDTDIYKKKDWNK